MRDQSVIALRRGGQYIGVLIPSNHSLDKRFIQTVEFGLVAVNDSEIACVYALEGT